MGGLPCAFMDEVFALIVVRIRIGTVFLALSAPIPAYEQRPQQQEQRASEEALFVLRHGTLLLAIHREIAFKVTAAGILSQMTLRIVADPFRMPVQHRQICAAAMAI